MTVKERSELLIWRISLKIRIKTEVPSSNLKPGFHMICNGLRPSEAVCVGLTADDRRHRKQMFPFKSLTSVPLIVCKAKRKRNALASSQIGRVSRRTIVSRRYEADHLRHMFPLKNVLVGSVVMVGEVELDSTFPIIQTVCRRSPQTPGTDVSIRLQRGADLSAIVSQISDRCRSYGNQPGFTMTRLSQVRTILLHNKLRNTL